MSPFTTTRPTSGGGIASSGALTLTASVVYANTAFNGGGVDVGFGTAVILNSTLSGNAAENTGGGLMVGGGSAVSLNNVTIADNSAGIDGGDGENKTGGVQLSFGSVAIQNSLVAGNRSQGDAASNTADCNAPLDSQGYNLTGANSGCDLSGVGDQTVTPGDVFVTVLGPLQNNGGPTWTHALLTGSPAIDAGSSSGCEATDQRGVTRPQGAACDVGAYEKEAALATHRAAPFVELPWATGSLFSDTTPDYILPLDTAVITPTNAALFDTLAPIEISGSASAAAYVRQVTLLVNGDEIYTADYAEQEQLTEAAWTTTFTPPGDGAYILVALAEDWVGNEQTIARPIEIMVATAAPAITITTEAITALSADGVPAQLVGAATAPGRAQVAVQLGAGEPFQPALYHDGRWSFGWNVDATLDGAYAGRHRPHYRHARPDGVTTGNVVVDMVAPEAVATAVQYRDQSGNAVRLPTRRDRPRHPADARPDLDGQRRRRRPRRLSGRLYDRGRAGRRAVDQRRPRRPARL
jgi:hypothetical protein